MSNFKTENDFNKYITSRIRLLGTSYKVLKTSDRFKSGVPDWIIFHDGKCVAVESKYIKDYPKRGNLLKHIVSGPQVTFMEGLLRAGIRSYVLVGVGSDKCMYLCEPCLFATGNTTVKEFYDNVGLYTCYSMQDIEVMLGDMYA